MFANMALDAVAKNVPSQQVLVAYTTFIGSTMAMHHLVAQGEFSSILTVAGMLQCFGFTLLVLQILMKGSSAGISARALVLDALALCCRLSSTTWLNGYLPVDASGDWVYQTVDVCSLALVSYLLCRVFSEKRRTCQDSADTFPVVPLAIIACLLAALLHADMNARPLFDTIWMAGLFISVVAVLPQLWLISRNGGSVEALTSHYIAAIGFSRILSGLFMWHARFDITCAPLVEGYNHAIWAILIAHLFHILLLADFAYYYLKAVASNGFGCCMDLAEACGV